MELDLEEELKSPSSSANHSLPTCLEEGSRLDTLPCNRNSIKSLIERTPSLMTLSTDSAIVTSMNTSAMSVSSGSPSIPLMANSTDSAIYSAPCSRSATASPVPRAADDVLRYAGAHTGAVHKYPLSVTKEKAQPPSTGVLDIPSNHLFDPSICDPVASTHKPHHISLHDQLHSHPCSSTPPDVTAHQNFSLIDHCLENFPPGSHFGSTYSFDSGISHSTAHNESNGKKCEDCKRNFNLQDNSDAFSVRSDISSASSRPQVYNQCNPCSRCTKVLNTISAVNNLSSVFNMNTCHSLTHEGYSSNNEDISETSQKTIITSPLTCQCKNESKSNRDSGCDFSAPTSMGM